MWRPGGRKYGFCCYLPTREGPIAISPKCNSRKKRPKLIKCEGGVMVFFAGSMALLLFPFKDCTYFRTKKIGSMRPLMIDWLNLHRLPLFQDVPEFRRPNTYYWRTGRFFMTGSRKKSHKHFGFLLAILVLYSKISSYLLWDYDLHQDLHEDRFIWDPSPRLQKPTILPDKERIFPILKGWNWGDCGASWFLLRTH